MRAVIPAAFAVLFAVSCTSAEARSPSDTVRDTHSVSQRSTVTTLRPSITASVRPVERPTPPTVAPAAPKPTSTTQAPDPVIVTPPAPPGSVEQIIRAAAAEFGGSGDLLVSIARCESGLDPHAVNSSSGALGLFQHLPRYWPTRAAGLGYSFDDWLDPTANARVSAKLLAEGGPGHWRACL